MNYRLLLFLLTLSCSAPAWAAIESVTVGADSVIITGKTASAKVIRLLELLPHQKDGAQGRPTAPATPGADGSFKLQIPRIHEQRDRIYSRWKLAAGQPPIYPTDVSSAAAHPGLKRMAAKNRKGVGGVHPAPELFPDLVKLGVGHITVNILIRQKFSKGQVDQLDRVLSFAHKNKIVVSAILLIPPKAPVLAHRDCDPSAHYALPDMNSQAGANAFAKSVRFLAERYCKPGFPNGRISHWIIGNEVDAGWVWTNAGEKTADQYMDEYQRALRVAYYSVRSFDPNGKVFISLTHHWTTPHRPNPKRFYQPRHLLNLLANHCKRSGDFEWGLAYHPYPDDLFNPSTWNDKKAHNNFDSPFITMKNIAVLDQFMQQPRFLYRGKTQRSILLSEQGFHTDKRNPEAENLQAAAIAYAWKNLKPLKSIKAFHYHRWIDHEREGGLNAGLWTVKKGSITSPDKKKKSWHLYRALGTPAEPKAIAPFEKYWNKKN